MRLQREHDDLLSAIRERGDECDHLRKIVAALRQMRAQQSPNDPGAALEPFLEQTRVSILETMQQLDPSRLKSEQQRLLLEHEALRLRLVRWSDAELDPLFRDVVAKFEKLAIRRKEMFAADRGGDSIRTDLEMRPFLDQFPRRNHRHYPKRRRN
jgi:hypothetical protein